MSNICVFSPYGFEEEKEYVFSFIFKNTFGVSYELKFEEDQKDYKLTFGEKSIIFSDVFFSKFNNEKKYLHKDAIPKNIEYFDRVDFYKFSIPIIYGKNKVFFNELKIILGLDIVASIFFMLTRWEEVVNDNLDNHGRYPAEESLAFKKNFLHIPVVNLYIELLWASLLKIGYDGNRKKQLFNIIPTHDIDFIRPQFNLRVLAVDFILTKSFKTIKKRIKLWYLKKNIYDTFDWIMNISEKNNLISRFYFLSDGYVKNNVGFKFSDPLLLDIITRIYKRNHIVGLHPGYDTFNNPEEWKSQKVEFEKVIGKKVLEGRQHYLRFNNPVTWKIWEENGMKLDSTMGYASQPGFRCGTSLEFPVFDVLNKKQLNLIERPLVAMDTTFSSISYQNVSLDETFNTLSELKATCKKFNIPFTILFHNTSFNSLLFKGWENMYERLLSDN